MRVLKKFIFFLLFIPLTNLFATPQKISLEAAVFHAKQSLFSNVLKDLQKYYGKLSFEDSTRQTGWYRVEDFLVWLKENESLLQSKIVRTADKKLPLMELYTSPEKEDKILFWGYLGAQYAFSRYHLNAKILDRYSFATCTDVRCYATPSQNTITLSGTLSFDLPAFFNISLHETVHLFSTDLRKWDYYSSLPEAAACKAQNLWALPVKPHNNFFSGTRDFRLAYERGIPVKYLMNEYISCIITPLYGMEVFEDIKTFKEPSLHSFLEDKHLPPLSDEILRIDGFAHEDVLKDFFGSEVWEEKLVRVEQNTFASFGIFPYLKVRSFYKTHFEQTFPSMESSCEGEPKIKETLKNISNSAHLAFLYKQGDKVWFAFFPIKDIASLPDQKIISELHEKEVPISFYKKVVRKYFAENLNSQHLFPYIIELLDQQASKESRSKVPAGYI